jgi:protein phosphatase 1B
VTAKETNAGATTTASTGPYTYCHVSMQGWRESMEDSHIINPEGGLAVFAVFDGHGGDEVALEVEKIGHGMCMDVAELKTVSSGCSLADARRLVEKGGDTAFRRIDVHLRSLNTESGCTANVVFVSKDLITCANIGDSRSILCRAGTAMALSKDHKPTDDGETERIKKAGGSVIRGRVCGGVAVSRSFGDFAFKSNAELDAAKQQISCCPDFIHFERDAADDEFILICCDGVWDMMANDAACRFVRTRLQAGISDLEVIGSQLLDFCLDKGSKDNMTCVIVLLEAGIKLVADSAPKKGCCKGYILS